MKVDLIIDGNYILNRIVFSLQKYDLLEKYGNLNTSLEKAINTYKKRYPFANVYLVSDSKEKSWRRELMNEYKGTRKKDSKIDWSAVYNVYSEFKDNLNHIKIMEAPKIEGDDWISFLVNEANKNGRSTMIISNDYDIKQLLKFNTEPLYMNMMTNEMYEKGKIFLPNNYEIFLSNVNSLNNNDLFDMNYNNDYLMLINGFLKEMEVVEIDPTEILLIKLISGDSSDNISSALEVTTKTGRKRGIGETGAKTILENYINEFGQPDMNDPDLFENIADLICEKKKLGKSNIEMVVNNLKQNSKLIDLSLDKIPDYILIKMDETLKSKLLKNI